MGSWVLIHYDLLMTHWNKSSYFLNRWSIGWSVVASFVDFLRRHVHIPFCCKKRSHKIHSNCTFTFLFLFQDPCIRTHMSRQATQGIPVRNTGSPKSAVKTRQSFFLHTTYLTKLARQVCRSTLQLKRAARRPFVLINCAAIRAECKMFLNS